MMKGILVGLVAVAGSVGLFTLVLGILHLDARYLMGRFYFLSLPLMVVIFALGLWWQLSRERARLARG